MKSIEFKKFNFVSLPQEICYDITTGKKGPACEFGRFGFIKDIYKDRMLLYTYANKKTKIVSMSASDLSPMTLFEWPLLVLDILRDVFRRVKCFIIR